MNIENRIAALSLLEEYMLRDSESLTQAIDEAYHRNKWFTPDNMRYALNAIARNFLNPQKLRKWLCGYSLKEKPVKRVGIVMAGNVPLAGFHDLLCVLLSGHKAVIKLSSKDNVLLPHLLEKLCSVVPHFKEHVEFAERLKNMDAVIATGSNNTSRYFDYYFGKYPHIIRKNRNSVAVLDGSESKTDLMHLGDDIFLYFGLGCRSVSKLYVPEGYSFNIFFEAMEPFSTIMLHDGYKNNYDYNRTLLLMNNVPHFACDFLMLQESASLASPIATVYFEYYRNGNQLAESLNSSKEEIQCVVGKARTGVAFADFIPFGKSQQPELTDYADGVDTLAFLNSLK